MNSKLISANHRNSRLPPAERNWCRRPNRPECARGFRKSSLVLPPSPPPLPPIPRPSHRLPRRRTGSHLRTRTMARAGCPGSNASWDSSFVSWAASFASEWPLSTCRCFCSKPGSSRFSSPSGLYSSSPPFPFCGDFGRI